MTKLIVKNESSLRDSTSMLRVIEVMLNGRISNHEKQYCYATVFSDCVVFADITRNGTDVFTVRNRDDC